MRRINHHFTSSMRLISTSSNKPMSSFESTIKSSIVGSTAGLCGSLVGLGGGFLAIPLLTGWLNLTQRQAHGTSLGTVFATGCAGSAGYASTGLVDWYAVPPLALSGMVTSVIGARIAHTMNQDTLKLLLGICMIAMSPMIVYRDELLQYWSDLKKNLANENVQEDSKSVGVGYKMAVIGASSGFLAGLFGVGGGAITVPALVLFTDYSHKEALGLSLAAMILPSISGGYVHLKQGNLVPRIAAPLALGTALGAYFGSNFVAQKISSENLKIGFSIFTALMGFRTLQNPLKSKILKFVKTAKRS